MPGDYFFLNYGVQDGNVMQGLFRVNKTTLQLEVYNGTQWQLAGSSDSTATAMTTTQRTAITPAVGRLIWDTDLEALYVGDGVTAGGVAVASGGGGSGTVTGIESSVSGNTATITATGSTTNVKFTGLNGTVITGNTNGEIVVDTEDLEARFGEFKVFSVGPKSYYADGVAGVLFTNQDASPGDRLHYNFDVPENERGIIRFFDSSRNQLSVQVVGSTYSYTAIGKTSESTDLATHYEGELIIPENFAVCEMYNASGQTLTINDFYVNRFEDRMYSESLTIPPYYFDDRYLPKRVDAINNLLESTLAYGDSFVFITDTHLNANEWHSPALLRFIGNRTCLTKIFHGGDIDFAGGNTYYAVPRTRKFMSLLHEAFPRDIYLVVGNHETYQDNTPSRMLTYAAAYHDEIHGNPVKNYYYVDNERSKIRYIVLNQFYSGTDVYNGYLADPEQQNWFRNTALDLKDGWGAVILSHAVYLYPPVESGTRTMTLGADMKAKLLDVCDAYNANPNSKGFILAIVQGHTHADRVLRTDGGIPIIITTCDKNVDAFTDDIDSPDGPRLAGTIREQAFDIITVDRSADTSNQGTVYATRIGCPAYDGTTVDDPGSATNQRVVKYYEKGGQRYTITQISGTTEGTLYDGLTGSNTSMGFSIATNQTPIDMGGAVVTSAKVLYGNGANQTILTGSALLTSQVALHDLSFANATVQSGGRLILPETTAIQPGTTLAMSGAIVSVTGGTIAGSAVTLGGTMWLSSNSMIASGGKILVSGGALGISAGANVIGDNGVIDLTGTHIDTTDYVVSGCSIVNGGGAYGGAVQLNGGSAVFSDCVFSGNSSLNGNTFDIRNANLYLFGCLVSGNTGATYAFRMTQASSFLYMSGTSLAPVHNVYMTANGASAVLAGSNHIQAAINTYNTSGYVTISSGAVVDLTGNTNATAIAPGGIITVETGGCTVINSAGTAVPIAGGTYTQIKNDGTTV